MSSSRIDNGNYINLIGLSSINTSNREATNKLTRLINSGSSKGSLSNHQSPLEDLVLLSSKQISMSISSSVVCSNLGIDRTTSLGDIINLSRKVISRSSDQILNRTFNISITIELSESSSIVSDRLYQTLGSITNCSLKSSNLLSISSFSSDNIINLLNKARISIANSSLKSIETTSSSINIALESILSSLDLSFNLSTSIISTQINSTREDIPLSSLSLSLLGLANNIVTSLNSNTLGIGATGSLNVIDITDLRLSR